VAGANPDLGIGQAGMPITPLMLACMDTYNPTDETGKLATVRALLACGANPAFMFNSTAGHPQSALRFASGLKMTDGRQTRGYRQWRRRSARPVPSTHQCRAGWALPGGGTIRTCVRRATE